MPQHNRFQHQLYPTTPALNPTLRTLECTAGTDGEFSPLHSAFHIGRVILVHGTFMGDDPLGLAETLKSLAGSMPLIAASLEQLAATLLQNSRPLTASVVKDLGNYTPEYRDAFQKLVGDDPRVELLHPTWSSQNHHLARADLAVRLLLQLSERPLLPDQKVLLWGHSHAGNAFALLTNLLANDRPAVAKFFDAVGDQVEPHWATARNLLLNAPSPHPLASKLVIATFGTPVRYGWDTSGFDALVHVTQHRPFDHSNPWIAKPLFPPYSPDEVVNARWGDWIQAFGIAGTDISSVPSQAANEKLTSLLEANLPEPQHELDTRFLATKRLRDTCARWKWGTRCHADGQNLLVDYIPSGSRTPFGRPIETSMLGHGVATSLKWLPVHLKLVMEALGKPVPQ
jgi:hypothetical protein